MAVSSFSKTRSRRSAKTGATQESAQKEIAHRSFYQKGALRLPCFLSSFLERAKWFSLQDRIDFFIPDREGEVVAGGEGEDEGVVSIQLGRTYWRRADVEFVILERVPLFDGKDHDGNVLARDGDGPERIADGDDRARGGGRFALCAGLHSGPRGVDDRITGPACRQSKVKIILRVLVVDRRGRRSVYRWSICRRSVGRRSILIGIYLRNIGVLINRRLAVRGGLVGHDEVNARADQNDDDHDQNNVG